MPQHQIKVKLYPRGGHTTARRSCEKSTDHHTDASKYHKMIYSHNVEKMESDPGSTCSRIGSTPKFNQYRVVTTCNCLL